jgi:hypothetical protein
MSRVYVTSHHFEPHSHTLKGLTLHVQFEGGSAEVSMLDMPCIPEAEQPAGLQAAILRLGEAIVPITASELRAIVLKASVASSS